MPDCKNNNNNNMNNNTKNKQPWGGLQLGSEP